MYFTPIFSPQPDGFVAAALTLFSAVCALSWAPSVIVGVLCARAMDHLNTFQAIMLGLGMAMAAYALCVALSTLGIFIYYSAGDDVLIAYNVIVSAVVGASGATATWRICLTWNRRRRDRLS